MSVIPVHQLKKNSIQLSTRVKSSKLVVSIEVNDRLPNRRSAKFIQGYLDAGHGFSYFVMHDNF